MSGENSTVAPQEGRPEREAIPIPVIDRRTQAWRRHPWPSSAVLLPPLLRHSPHLTSGVQWIYRAYVGVGLLTAVLVIFAYSSFRLDSNQIDDLLSPRLFALAMGELALSLAGVILRRHDRAPATSRFLIVLFTASSLAAWALIGLVALAQNGYAGVTPVFSVNLPACVEIFAYVVLTLVAWNLLDKQAGRHRRFRSEVSQHHQDVPLVPSRVLGSPLVSEDQTRNSVELRRRSIAETLTSPLLDELLLMPGVQIVNGIAFPGSQTERIGHAVVAGTRIAFIDSVLWDPGHYELDSHGRIIVDGGLSEQNTVQLGVGLRRFLEKMPGATIRAWVVIHKLRSGELSVTTNESSLVRLATADSLLGEVGDWLAEEGSTVNVFALRFVRTSHRP